MKRKDLLAMMTKLGIEFTSKINVERATNKIVRHLESEGLPEDVELTADEIAFLKGMGFDIEIEGPEDDDDSVEETDADDSTSEDTDDEDDSDEEDDDEDEEDEDDEDEDDEEESAPAPKKSKKKAPAKKEKKPKPKKEKKPKRKARLDSICDVIRTIPEDGISIEDLATQANEDCIENGGGDNMEQSIYMFTRFVSKILTNYGIVRVEGDTVYYTGS